MSPGATPAALVADELLQGHDAETEGEVHDHDGDRCAAAELLLPGEEEPPPDERCDSVPDRDQVRRSRRDQIEATSEQRE